MSERVHLEHNWPNDTVKVYVYRPTGPGAGQTLRYDPAADWPLKWVETPAGEKPDPTFEMPQFVLEALVTEASDYLPPSAGQAAALADTQAVRDRLLSLVERLAAADTVAQ